MPDGITCDNSEFMNYATDLDHVPDGAGLNIIKAVHVSSRNIKDGWREQLEGSETIPHGSRAISYDINGSAVADSALDLLAGATGLTGRSEIVSEIGPRLNSSQGPIVGIVETGTPTIAPRGYGAYQLEAEIPGFEAGLAKAVGDVL